MRLVVPVLLVLLLLLGGAWFLAGRATGPAIEIVSPKALLGQAGTLDVAVTAPGGSLTDLDVEFIQGDRRTPLFGWPGTDQVEVRHEEGGRVRVTRALNKQVVPELANGPAQMVVTASRPVLWGLRSVASAATADLTVRLEPPRVAVLSNFHFINHGGSEVVVYRATPADVESGVRVGDRTYPGFPAAGAGIANADPAMRVAFFALLHDQDRTTPIRVYARDGAGNEAATGVDTRVFPKPFRQSRIEVPEAFLARVVPEILQHSPTFKVNDPNNLVEAFLAINRDLRRENNAAIAALAAKTSPKLLWDGPFQQLSNTQVESTFADRRTYFHDGKEIDRQVHLGFDLASQAKTPVHASNAGVVVFADFLGIYGNCVVVDHGLGVQSLYGHLSSFEVNVGASVAKGQSLGRSGMTGLAGGDHLHFTTLVGGQAVTPVDWWSKQWVEDRILRKFREAGASKTE